MTRGRKPDAPALAAAKGNPGRRRRKAKDTPEQRAAELAKVAPIPDSGAPEFLATDERLRPALAIWCEYAAELRRLNLLDVLDRHTFAMWCVHMADWIKATQQIAEQGHSYTASNVNGDRLDRLNPWVKARELAEKHILDIGARFGLDPAARYKVLRDQAASSLGGLFGERGANVGGGEAGEVSEDRGRGGEGVNAPADDDPVGMMRRASTPPPLTH